MRETRWIVWHPRQRNAYQSDNKETAWRYAREDARNIPFGERRTTNKALKAAGWRGTEVTVDASSFSGGGDGG